MKVRESLSPLQFGGLMLSGLLMLVGGEISASIGGMIFAGGLWLLLMLLFARDI